AGAAVTVAGAAVSVAGAATAATVSPLGLLTGITVKPSGTLLRNTTAVLGPYVDSDASGDAISMNLLSGTLDANVPVPLLIAIGPIGVTVPVSSTAYRFKALTCAGTLVKLSLM